jgi:hypothetical protein
MDANQLTVVPVMPNRNVRFLVVGHGIDLPTLKRQLPVIKHALNKLACALQILWLRKQILDKGDGPSPCQMAV